MRKNVVTIKPQKAITLSDNAKYRRKRTWHYQTYLDGTITRLQEQLVELQTSLQHVEQEISRLHVELPISQQLAVQVISLRRNQQLVEQHVVLGISSNQIIRDY